MVVLYFEELSRPLPFSYMVVTSMQSCIQDYKRAAVSLAPFVAVVASMFECVGIHNAHCTLFNVRYMLHIHKHTR